MASSSHANVSQKHYLIRDSGACAINSVGESGSSESEDDVHSLDFRFDCGSGSNQPRLSVGIRITC